MRSSAMSRRLVASAATAAEGSVWSCKRQRCPDVNLETVMILVFKLEHF